RFNNKTNGITPRRWLLVANPLLSAAITQAIGHDWTTSLDKLRSLEWLAEDANFQSSVLAAKHQAKVRLTASLKSTTRLVVDPETMFDCQVKRIHEYKRQLLNVLRIIVLYNRMRQDPDMAMPPRTFLFAGKAAPAYRLAKLIIKLINNLADMVDADPATRG